MLEDLKKKKNRNSFFDKTTFSASFAAAVVIDEMSNSGLWHKNSFNS